MAQRYARSRASTTSCAMLFTRVLGCLLLGKFPDHLEHLADLLAQFGKISRQQRFLRIDHDVRRALETPANASRTASRSRRRIRLRCTAPPSSLLTVKPMRSVSPLPRAASKTRSCAPRNDAVPACKPARSRRAAAGGHRGETLCACRNQTRWDGSWERHRSRFTIQTQVAEFPPIPERRNATHGSRVLPTPACAPWRAGAKSPPPRLGLHTRAKAVRLRAVTAVGLERALGHETWLLLTGLSRCYERWVKRRV